MATVIRSESGTCPLTASRLLKSPLKELSVRSPSERETTSKSAKAIAKSFILYFYNAKNIIINKYRRLATFLAWAGAAAPTLRAGRPAQGKEGEAGRKWRGKVEWKERWIKVSKAWAGKAVAKG